MCYSAVSITRQLVKYAKHRSDDKKKIEELEKQLQLIVTSQHKFYFADGYAHPRLLVFTDKEPFKPQLFYWGLIPSWIKTKADAFKIANQTLNARCETLFEKPAFKNSAKNNRCLIFLDAFYEYHHFENGTYPYHISSIDDEPLTIAGIWSEWADPDTGELIPTVSIVTTKANKLLKQIHNNPKQDEARMPVILKKDEQEKWLEGSTENELKALLVPYDDHQLKAHTVKKLKGKNASGNSLDAEKPYYYPELAELNSL